MKLTPQAIRHAPNPRLVLPPEFRDDEPVARSPRPKSDKVVLSRSPQPDSKPVADASPQTATALKEPEPIRSPQPAVKIPVQDPETALIAEPGRFRPSATQNTGASLLFGDDSGGFMLAGVDGPTNLSSASSETRPHTPAEKAELLDAVKSNESSAFPQPYDGVYSNYGMSVYLLEGKAAEGAVDFANDLEKKEFDYDAARHSVIATVQSDDEPSLGVYVVDRQSKDVAFKSYGNTVDLPYDMPAEKLSKHFPNVEEYEAPFQVVGEIASGGELLGHLQNPADVAEGLQTDKLDFREWAPSR